MADQTATEALISLQRAVGTSVKKDTNGHGYKYVKLDRLLKTVAPLISDHGFALITTQESSDGVVVHTTTALLHESGETFSSTVAAPLDSTGSQQKGAQYAGSLITYSRRYAIMNLLGVTMADDDDGAFASGGTIQVDRVAGSERAKPKQSHWDAGLVSWLVAEGLDTDALVEWIQLHGWDPWKFTKAKQKNLLKELEEGSVTIP